MSVHDTALAEDGYIRLALKRFLDRVPKPEIKTEISSETKNEEKKPSNLDKVCPACGPVVTRYSNCPRCWGPVHLRKKNPK